MMLTLTVFVLFAVSCLAAAVPEKDQPIFADEDQDVGQYESDFEDFGLVARGINPISGLPVPKAHPHHKHKHKKHKKGHKKHLHKHKHKHKKHKKAHNKHHGKHKKHKKGHKKPKYTLNTDPDFIKWSNTCQIKDQQIGIAINEFCTYGKTLMAPGTPAHSRLNHKIQFAPIMTTCKPPAKIGWQLCRKNFNKVCAEGDADGLGYQMLGPNKCVAFTISVDHFDINTNEVTMIN